VAVTPSNNLKINASVLIATGLVLLFMSVLVFFMILKFIYGDFTIEEILPTKENLTLISEKREKKAAILYSRYTENMLPEGNTWLAENVSAWESYIRSIRMPYDLLSDLELENGDLDDYGLLILPGTKSLSDRQIIQVKKYLELGGSILATGGTCTFSDEGKWRGWEFFSEVFGLKFTKEIKPFEKYKHHTLRGNLPVTAGIPAGYELTIATWDLPIYAEILDPRTTQVSSWYDFRKEDGLVREEIKKSAGIAYGKYGKGKYFWMGFEINSVIGNSSDYIYFDKLLNNGINWLTGLPTASVKEWPSDYSSASLFIPAVTENPNNINNLLNILRTYEYQASFYVDENVIRKNRNLVKSLLKYGDLNSIIDVGFKLSANDTINQLFPRKEQEKKMSDIGGILKKISEKNSYGFMPLSGFYDENTLQAVTSNNIKYIFTDSLTGRAVPKLEIRNEKPVMIITKTARDDKMIIGNYGLKEKNFQLYTYQEDIDRIIFEGGLYVLKSHTDYQLRPEYVDVIKDVFNYIKANKIWHTSIRQLDKWWTFRANIELKYDIRSNKRMFLEVSSPDYETKEKFVIKLNINKPVENVIVSSDIINTEIPAYEFKEDEQILYLYFNGFQEGESRSFLIDYQNVN